MTSSGAADWVKSVHEPWVARVHLDPEVDELRELGEAHGLVVAVVDGLRMSTARDVFRELGSAMKFPPFGQNWDAFEEYLADLDWLPGTGYLIVVENAERLLSRDYGHLRIFVRVARQVGSEWALPVELGEEWDRPARPFRVVLATDSRGGLELDTRLRAEGIDVPALA